jgi:CheY-like chemotaxis protein
MENVGTLAIDLAEAAFNETDAGRPIADTEPGKYVKLTVSDTGTGIPDEIRTRIFDPFFTTKGPGKGTGMGLAVVFGIVKSHGGELTVTSKVGEGSAFSIFFPLLEKTEREQAVDEGLLPQGRERVLVVDDEPSIVEMTAKTLKHLGYAVTTARSGPEGWRKFEDDPHRFDLVITDHVMPEITGLRLAERMLEVRSDLPVILCTGYSDMISAETAKAAGVSEFLMKPAARQEVASAVRRALDSKRMS